MNAPSDILKYFEYGHLPEHLQGVSEPMAALAHRMEKELPACAEKSAGLRKLLEAKDCFVRAALEKPLASVTAEPLKPGQPGYGKCVNGCKFPISDCPNMKEKPGDLSMEYEHYECSVCGLHDKLDYEEMR